MAELARVGNWVGELTATTGTGNIELGGALNGFTTFSSMGDGEVYYALVEGNDREAGKGTLIGTVLQRTDIYSTLVDGVYNEVDPQPIELEGLANIFCTFNERAFRELNQTALTVSYDNSVSGASSTNVGDALNELFNAPGAREFKKIPIPVEAGQTLIFIEPAFNAVILVINGVVKLETNFEYSIDLANRTILLASPLVGDEIVEVWLNELVVNGTDLFPVKSISSPYSLNPSDSGSYLVFNSESDGTIIAPADLSIGTNFLYANVGSGNVKIETSGSESLRGKDTLYDSDSFGSCIKIASLFWQNSERNLG